MLEGFIKLKADIGNKCKAVSWKSEDPPTVSVWLQETASYTASEKINVNVSG